MIASGVKARMIPLIGITNNRIRYHIPLGMCLNYSGVNDKAPDLKETLTKFEGNKKIFEETLKFPCDFLLKVIGVNSTTFQHDMVAIVSQVSSQPLSKIQVFSKETAGGKYVSVSIKTEFSNSDVLYTTYSQLGKDSRVKFLL